MPRLSAVGISGLQAGEDVNALPGHSRGSTARFQGTPRGGVGVKGRRGCWRGPQPAGRGHGQPRRGRSPALDAYGTPIASAGEQEKGEARPLLPRRMGQDPMRGSSPKGAGQARRARRGDSSPPLGASICGRGSRREAVGEPRRGAPCLGTPAAPRVAHRPGFDSGLFCWFFSCFFLFFRARARGLPAKPYLARVCGGF